MEFSVSPYLKINENIKYDFYCIIIKDYDEDNATIGTQELISKLTGYSINEYVFRAYLKYYERSLEFATFVTVKYDNMVYNEFKDKVKKDFGLVIVDDHYIDMDIADIFGNVILYNGLLETSMYEYKADYNDMDDLFIPAIFQGYELLSNTYKSYFTDEFSIVKKLIDRVCKLYIPIIGLLEYGELEGEDWFLDLPDYVKMNITKEANFPKPIETIDWFDIISLPYQLYYFINNICDYTGGPEDG